MTARRPAQPRRRPWFVFLTLATALVGMAGLLLALEVGLRLWDPQLGPPMGMRDPDGFPRLRSSLSSVMSGAEFRVRVRTDTEGHRVCPMPPPTRVGERPVLMLGDSFAFGWGVEAEDGVACRVQGSLGRLVINDGVPGDGPREERRRSATDVSRYRPSAVILLAFGGNDLDDVERERASLIADWEGSQSRTYRWRIGFPFKRALSTRSHAYVFLARRWSALLIRLRLRENRLPFSRAYLRGARAEYVARGAALSRALSEMGRTANAAGATLVVVYVPHVLELDPSLRARLRDTYGLAPSELQPDTPFRIVEEAARSAGARLVDAREVFKGVPPQDLYFPLDGHWTPLAHGLVAAALVAELSHR